MRIHVLAKELGIENKVLVEFLQKQGADVKSHMSSCPDNMIDLVREKFGEKRDTADCTGRQTGDQSSRCA